MEDWKLCQEFSSYLKAILPLARLIIYIYIYIYMWGNIFHIYRPIASMGYIEPTMEDKAHSRKWRQAFNRVKAHFMIKCSIRIDTSYNEPFTGHNCAGGRAFISIPFVTLEDPPREPIHQSFIGEKGKILTHIVYAERIPGNLTGTNITDLSGALNGVSGIFGSLCPVRISRQSSRNWLAEFIEWIRKQVSYTLCINVKSS